MPPALKDSRVKPVITPLAVAQLFPSRVSPASSGTIPCCPVSAALIHMGDITFFRNEPTSFRVAAGTDDGVAPPEGRELERFRPRF